MLPAFPFCCYLSRWVVSALGRGHVYTPQTFPKYLHYRWGRSLLTNSTHQRKECRVCRSQPASTCTHVKLSIPMPDHKQQSAPEVSWKLGNTEMTLNQCCLGDGSSVLESALGLRVFHFWPRQREGQGQDALEEPILCGILMWANNVYTLNLFFFKCLHLPTIRSPLWNYSIVSSVLREGLYFARWQGLLWWKVELMDRPKSLYLQVSC